MDFNKLWANFMDTVQNHYMDFNGRVGLTQYWYFVLAWAVAFVVITIIGEAIHLWLLMPIVGLAFALPVAAASARRIQDTGNNGQLALLWLAAFAASMLMELLGRLGIYIPILSGLLGELIDAAAALLTLAIIYFAIQRGQAEANAYGPPPAVWTPTAV